MAVQRGNERNFRVRSQNLLLQVQLKKSGGQVKMWHFTAVFVFLVCTVEIAKSSPKGRNGKVYIHSCFYLILVF